MGKEKQTTMNTGIYAIKNLVNNKMLVGSSVNIKSRLAKHLRMLTKNKHYNKPLQYEYNTYGSNNFHTLVIDICSKEQLAEKELHYINLFDSFNGGYNQTLSTTRNYINNTNKRVPFVVHDLLLDEVHHFSSLYEMAGFFGIDKYHSAKQAILFDGRYIKYRGTKNLEFTKYYLKDLNGNVIKSYPSKYHLSHDLKLCLSRIELATNNYNRRILNEFIVSTNIKITPYIEKRGVYNKDSLKKPIYSIDQYGNITYYDSVKEAAMTMPNKTAHKRIQECVNNKYKSINKYKNLHWYHA